MHEVIVRLANLPSLARLLFDFSKFFLIRSPELKSGLQACLDKAHGASTFPEGTELSDADRLRLKEYVLLGTALGETFSVLRGEPLNSEENAAFLHLSVFAPFYDDLFDSDEFKEARILEIMEDPVRCVPANFGEVLLTQALAVIHLHAPDRREFDRKFRELYEAQKEDMEGSRAGASKPVPEANLKKGGVSAQLYRCLLRHPLRPGEDEAFHRLGCLIQFMDDIFDVAQDHEAGRCTLATTSRDMSALRDWFRREVEETYGLFRALSYPAEDTRRFLFRVHFILSRGGVCLERLLALQQNNGGTFDPGHFEKDQLLVDMEKPGNFLRNLDYCLRFR